MRNTTIAASKTASTVGSLLHAHITIPRIPKSRTVYTKVEDPPLRVGGAPGPGTAGGDVRQGNQIYHNPNNLPCDGASLRPCEVSAVAKTCSRPSPRGPRSHSCLRRVGRRASLPVAPSPRSLLCRSAGRYAAGCGLRPALPGGVGRCLIPASAFCGLPGPALRLPSASYARLPASLPCLGCGAGSLALASHPCSASVASLWAPPRRLRRLGQRPRGIRLALRVGV